MQRRRFLQTSLSATALLSLPSLAAEKKTGAPRDLYELRSYRLKPEAKPALLDAYLEKALIPALNQRGIKNVGVFTETNPRPDPKEALAVRVLIPYPSADSFANIAAEIHTDPAVLQAGAEYLGTRKDNPAFDRIDSWLLLAFAGMPKLELAAHSLQRTPRLFELRTYESHNELKALRKVEMFNAGEIDAMREVGLAPVFYGQTLAGGGMPHLMYMTSGPDEATHKAHWSAFGAHPTWLKLKKDPLYADTVSKITKRFLLPTAYSQI
jgi:hypothetical protein